MCKQQDYFSKRSDSHMHNPKIYFMSCRNRVARAELGLGGDGGWGGRDQGGVGEKGGRGLPSPISDNMICPTPPPPSP